MCTYENYLRVIIFRHYDNTYNHFTYNDFTYNENNYNTYYR